MAFHKNINLTKERLIHIFRGRLLHDNLRETPQEYFRTLYPNETGFECIEIISGILMFLKDEIGKDEYIFNDFIIKIDDNCVNADIFRYLKAKRSIHITFDMYRSKYPSVHVRLGEDLFNNLNERKWMFTLHKRVIDITMSVLSNILASEYANYWGNDNE